MKKQFFLTVLGLLMFIFFISPINGKETKYPKWLKNTVGMWTGTFGINGKKLIIAIESVNGDNIYGYSILGTNKRSYIGTASNCNENSCFIRLEEPGDRNGDGIFEIMIYSHGLMEGSWHKYDNENNISKIKLSKN